MNLIAVLFLTCACRSLYISKTDMDFLLLPNTDNHITPFQIESTGKNEEKADYRLNITCNQQVIDKAERNSSKGDYCKAGLLTDNLDGINTILASLSIHTQDIEERKEFVIDYALYYIDEAGENQEFSFKQKLFVANQISVIKDNEIIQYQKGKPNNFELKILTIKQEYYKNAKDHEFVINFNNEKPVWVSYSFIANTLYFKGETPGNLDEEIEFSFTIYDKQTGLSSESVEIEFAKINHESSTGSSKLMILILFIIFSIVIIFIVVAIYYVAKKNKFEDRSLRRNNDELPTDGSVNVLSDSILNWNKQLVEKHKHKMVELTEGSDSQMDPDRAPAFSYNKFDESFDDVEDRSLKFKVSDKLSEIEHIEEEEKKEDDGNRSSFLDDFKF